MQNISSADAWQRIISAGHSIFRLQSLPEYRVESEADLLAQFVAGKPCPHDLSNPWFQSLKATVSRGVTWQNIHVLPRSLTTYLRYICDWCYSFYVPCGIDARFAFRSELSTDVINSLNDFWLLDETTLISISYTPAGVPIQRELTTDGGQIATASSIRDAVRMKSFDFSELQSKRRKGELL